MSKKRVKELKVIDPKASQNFGILLNSSLKGLSFEELRILILKCDDSSLSEYFFMVVCLFVCFFVCLLVCVELKFIVFDPFKITNCFIKTVNIAAFR